MSILLIAEHNNKEIKPFTFNAISAASKINEDVHVLVLGSNSDSVAKSISEVPNVKKVIHINNEIYEERTILKDRKCIKLYRKLAKILHPDKNEKHKDLFIKMNIQFVLSGGLGNQIFQYLNL